MGPPVIPKVVAYVLHPATAPSSAPGGLQWPVFPGLTGASLLVFEHVDAPEAGVQVPAGTIAEGETPEQTALREVAEETGLTGVRIVRKVGTFPYFHGERCEWHQRHVFVLAAEGPVQARWTHVVTASGEDGGLRFACYWLDAAEARARLATGQGLYLPAALGEGPTVPEAGSASLFVGEPIDFDAPEVMTTQPAMGQPPCPTRFRWRDRPFHVVHIVGHRRKFNREGYVQAHDYHVRTQEGLEMILRCERSTRGGRGGRNPWRLFAILPPS